ncbi:hypothetical protein DCCM_0965 [Desulfocucumis palustris]|uniref:Uncharacterized protein n=1 Tax=Desulfocucumis palustris TaxID=1898651 RepID=A0A2L2X961_9FIRM|nr:hypothetical protein DCCM_0965 [Desulfocucumis palustris]
MVYILYILGGFLWTLLKYLRMAGARLYDYQKNTALRIPRYLLEELTI